jgi:glucose-1-phosphate adenylyltransferase
VPGLDGHLRVQPRRARRGAGQHDDRFRQGDHPGLLGKKRLFAHIFEGYWEDIGTVRAFFDANLALAQPLPPFNFFDETAPIYTKDQYLPPSKINRCNVDHGVFGDGCIIEDSTIVHSVLGIRSFVRARHDACMTW